MDVGSSETGAPDGSDGRVAGRELLAELAQLSSSSPLPLDTLLTVICGRLGRDAAVERAWVFAVDASRDGVAQRARYAAPGLCETSGYQQLDTAVQHAVAADLARSAFCAVAVPRPADRAILTIALRDGGRTIGAVVLHRAGGHPFTPDEAAFADIAAFALSYGLQRAEGQHERVVIDRQAQAVRMLLEDGTRATSIQQVGVLLAKTAAQAFHAERAGVYLVGIDGIIDYAVGVGITPQLSAALASSLQGQRADGSPVWRRTATALGPVLVQDASSTAARPGGFVHTLGFHSYVAIPLLSAEGPVGLIIVGDASRPRTWIEQDRAVAEQLAWEGALVVDGVRLRAAERSRVAELTHQASHDPMTGLGNRALLMERATSVISAAQHSDRQLALLLLDLDDFKGVNDTLGHHYGDLLLQAVASRLMSVVRGGDTVSRLGGDEFAVLLASQAARDAASIVAGKIVRCLQTPFLLGGIPLQVEASIGIALFPAHGRDATSLLQHADAAMYKAKRAGCGPMVYDPRADTATLDHLSIYTELHRAIDRDELLLQYQPKIDLTTGAVVGVEALVRWQHPRRGLLSPERFLPVAETTGLIDRLTHWVLTAAADQWQAWSAAGLDLDLAINISARDLRNPVFADHLRSVLRVGPGSGLATHLTLEITETAMIIDPGLASQLLRPMRELGVRVSIDDFGAGYSSLGQLRELPVDELKIDRSLIRDVGSNQRADSIASAVTDLGHRLDLTVVAEGIERQHTRDALRRLGCDHGQGFYLCRPLTSSDLHQWVRQPTTAAHVID